MQTIYVVSEEVFDEEENRYTDKLIYALTKELSDTYPYGKKVTAINLLTTKEQLQHVLSEYKVGEILERLTKEESDLLERYFIAKSTEKPND